MAEAEIDVELEAVLAERAAIAADARRRPRSTTYEQLRHDLGGIGVARLVGTNCGGCHLTLSAVELDRIRHAAARRAGLLRRVRPPARALTPACSSGSSGSAPLFVWNVFRSPALDYRLVMLGSVLPLLDVVARRPARCCTRWSFTVRAHGRDHAGHP